MVLNSIINTYTPLHKCLLMINNQYLLAKVCDNKKERNSIGIISSERFDVLKGKDKLLDCLISLK